MASGSGNVAEEVWLADPASDPHFLVAPRLPLPLFLTLIAVASAVIWWRNRNNFYPKESVPSLWYKHFGPRATKSLVSAQLFLLLGLFCYGYLVALEGHADIMIALPTYQANAPYFFIAVLASWLASILLFVVIRQGDNIIVKVMVAFSHIISHIFVFSIDFGGDLRRHGQFNFALYVILTVIVIVVSGFFILLTRLAKTKTSRTLSIVSILVLFAMVSYLRIVSVKSRYETGLGGVKLQFDLPGCNIDPSLIPWSALLPGPLIRLILSPYTCPYPQSQFSNLNGSLLTVECPVEALVIEDPDYVSSIEVFHDSLGITDYVKNKTFAALEKRHLRYAYSKPISVTGEWIEVQCGSDRNYFVHIRPNETIPPSLPPPSQRKSLNVMILMVDSLSRNYFHDKMPETMEVLEELNADENSPSKVFEFFRFSSVALTTVPNLAALFSGKMLRERVGAVRDYKVSHLWDLENYTSGYAMGMCQSTIDQAWILQLKGDDTLSFAPSRPTHSMWWQFCHAETFPQPDPLASLNHGPYSANSRCIGSKYAHQYIIDFSEQFLASYRDRNPNLLISIFMEGHEGTYEVVRTLDPDFASFLRRLKAGNVMNDTLIAIMADHGMHMSPFRSSLEGQRQIRMPGLFFLVPRWLLRQHPRYEANLKYNVQRPFTHFDLFWTLRGAANYDTLDKLPKCPPQSTLPRSLDFAQTIFAPLADNFSNANRDMTFHHETDNLCNFLATDKVDLDALYEERGSFYNEYCTPN